MIVGVYMCGLRYAVIFVLIIGYTNERQRFGK